MTTRLVALASLFLVLLSTAPRAQQQNGRVLEVRARALDESGAPIEGAGVAVGEWPTAEDALQRPVAVSDADGQLNFRVTIPDNNTRGAMLLAAPGRSCFRCQLWLMPFPMVAADGDPLDIGDVRLPRGHTVTGRVRDAEGKPVAGARVGASDHLSTSPMFRAFASQTVTDERGVFVLRGATGRAMSLRVRADGFYEEVLAGVRPGTPLDLTLESSAVLSGRVTTDGEPFEGFAVRLGEFFAFDSEAAVVHDGAFRVPATTRGRFRIALYSRSMQLVGESDLLDGAVSDIEIVARAPDEEQCYRVHAVDAATSEAVPGIRAAAMWFGDSLDPWMIQMLQASMLSADADGIARLHPQGYGSSEGTLVVIADGWAPLVKKVTNYRAGETEAVELTRGATLRGRLVDEATGAPMAGVIVEAVEVGKQDSQWPARATTAADGAFQLADLPAGRCRLTARFSGGTVQAKKVVKLEAGAELADVELRMPAGVTVRGRLRGDYAQRPDWRVVIAPKDAGPHEPLGYDDGYVEPPTARLVDGAFALPRRGREEAMLFLIVPQPPRSGDALWLPLAPVTIAREDVELDLDVTPHLPGVVHGKLDVRGAALPMDRLVVMAASENDEYGAEPDALCLVAADGSYRMTLPKGTHDLVVLDPVTGVLLSTEAVEVTVGAGQEHRRDLVLPLATLHLRFRTDAHLIPVQSVQVQSGDGDAESFLQFGGTTLGTTGVELRGANRPVTLFLPPGAHDIVLQQGADSIGHGMTSSSQPLPSVRFDLAAGEERTEALDVPAPLEIQTK